MNYTRPGYTADNRDADWRGNLPPHSNIYNHMTIQTDTRTDYSIVYHGFKGAFAKNYSTKPPCDDAQTQAPVANVITVPVQMKRTIVSSSIAAATTINVTDANADAEIGDEIIFFITCDSTNRALTLGTLLVGASNTCTASKVNTLRFVFDGTNFRQTDTIQAA